MAYARLATAPLSDPAGRWAVQDQSGEARVDYSLAQLQAMAVGGEVHARATVRRVADSLHLPLAAVATTREEELRCSDAPWTARCDVATRVTLAEVRSRRRAVRAPRSTRTEAWLLAGLRRGRAVAERAQRNGTVAGSGGAAGQQRRRGPHPRLARDGGPC